MGHEGDVLVSELPVVDEIPLTALTGNEDQAAAREEEPSVPVAEFQSSI